MHGDPQLDATALVVLRGDVDACSNGRVFEEIDATVEAGRSVLVDFSDCTFLDLATLRGLRAAFARARWDGRGFAAVLPFSAALTVRRLVLELASELAEFPVFHSRAAAELAMRSRRPLTAERLRRLRADVWANGVRRDELLARRDELLLDQRLALAALRRR